MDYSTSLLYANIILHLWYIIIIYLLELKCNSIYKKFEYLIDHDWFDSTAGSSEQSQLVITHYNIIFKYLLSFITLSVQDYR